MIRCAFLGKLGHAFGALHALPKLPEAELVAYAPIPPEEESLAVFDGWKAQMGNARGYESYEELIEKEKPDLVQVSGAFYRNGEVAAYAAAHGCHVVVEKPIATELDLLAKLKAAVDKGGVELTAMLGSRLAPAFAVAKKAVAEGAIGEPVQVFAQKSYRFGTSRPAYYKDRRKYGGTIPWVAIHAIDWIHFILGDKFAQVIARHRNFTLSDWPGCEDAAAILFDLANGGTALVNADYLRPAGAKSHGDDRIRIAGTTGIIEVIGNQNRAVLIDAGGERDLPAEGAEGNIFASFARHLALGTPHPISTLESFRVTEIALKAREAADTGRSVGLADSPYKWG